MNIYGIDAYKNTTTYSAKSTVKTSDEKAAANTSAAEKTAQTKAPATDTLELSPEAKKTAETYTKPTKAADENTVSKLWAESEQKINEFKQMLEQMLAKQAKTNGAQEKNGSTSESSSFDFSMEISVKISGTSLSTTEGVGDNDYWGIEQTAQRLFDFAYGLAGDDKELMKTMVQAVKDGFGAVEDIFGGEGKLPDISYSTYDRTMELFDNYFNGDNAEE